MSTYEYIKRNSKVDVDKTDLHGQSKLKVINLNICRNFILLIFILQIILDLIYFYRQILLFKNNDSFNKVQYVSIIKFRDDKLQFDDNSGRFSI